MLYLYLRIGSVILCKFMYTNRQPYVLELRLTWFILAPVTGENHSPLPNEDARPPRASLLGNSGNHAMS